MLHGCGDLCCLRMREKEICCMGGRLGWCVPLTSSYFLLTPLTFFPGSYCLVFSIFVYFFPLGSSCFLLPPFDSYCLLLGTLAFFRTQTHIKTSASVSFSY